MDLDFIKKLVKPAKTKIVLLVLDGLGGLPMEPGGPTELEAANTPNLDKLAVESVCGLQLPVGTGITPGSGPGHLGLFGYDPIKYQVGRGVLSALGINFQLTDKDVAARGNFATIDKEGRVSDRRAGRISTEKNKELVKLLQDGIELPGVELFIETVKEHRLLLVLRGDDLNGAINDTDPQEVGEFPLDPKARAPEAERAAQLVKQFVDQARDILKEHDPANMVLLRGFSKQPKWPSFDEVFGLKAGAIAAYPMYRGVAKLVGMDLLEIEGSEVADEFSTLEKHWTEFDFFYLHVKRIDSAGEDGDFSRKRELIEEADNLLPRLLDLEPDVVVVTGDHSTPSYLKYHSWHPVPVLIWSKQCRPDRVEQFGDRDCIGGGLGPRFPSQDLIPLALANALRLDKFGA
jgi:2,3-bisphosphoglycerate-independent phosphoglycerate mutase